jgi:hypothetical protein
MEPIGSWEGEDLPSISRTPFVWQYHYNACICSSCTLLFLDEKFINKKKKA